MMHIDNDKIEPLLRKIVDKYEGKNGTLPEYLVEELTAIEKMYNDLLRLKQCEREARLEHAKIMAGLGAQRCEIQDRCLHLVITHDL